MTGPKPQPTNPAAESIEIHGALGVWAWGIKAVANVKH